MQMISYGRPQGASASVNSRCSSSRFGASLKIGMTTDRSGRTAAILSRAAASQEDRDEADGEDGNGQPERHGWQVLADEVGRPFAVPVGQPRFAAIPEAAAESHGRHEGE